MTNLRIMTKDDLRRAVRRIKEMTPLEQRKEMSKNVLKSLESNSYFGAAKTILLYYSLKDEVCTHEFINKWSKQKRILLPVVVGDELIIREFESQGNMKKGPFGIKEPRGNDFTNYEEIDLTIVPGVAFDTNGNRIGRGKGYYDKLLKKMFQVKKPHTIGLCFNFQEFYNVPTEEHDIKMDEVICY